MLKEGTETVIGFILLLVTTTYGGFSIGQYVGQQADLAVPAQPVNSVSDMVLSNDQIAGTASTALSVDLVAKHNTPPDCWLIIANKVYAVSSYLNQHPGGAFRITPYCGQDATQAFATQGGEGTHSSIAIQELIKLYIGDIGGVVKISGSQGTYNNSSSDTLPITTTIPSATGITGKQVSLALTEVAKHNAAKDCWLIISGNVYNATQYLYLHPGGANRIISYCGKDATQAFATQGGNGQHSSAAQADLAQLLIGPVGGYASATATNPPAPASSGQNGDDEEEHEYEYEDD